MLPVLRNCLKLCLKDALKAFMVVYSYFEFGCLWLTSRISFHGFIFTFAFGSLFQVDAPTTVGRIHVSSVILVKLKTPHYFKSHPICVSNHSGPSKPCNG